VSQPTADFLLEIGVEELPASYIAPALAQLESELKESFGELRLPFSDCATFSTPRRLAVLVTDLLARQADYEEEAMGPPWSAAYDKDGQPTKALVGFCKGKGVELADVRKVETAKGAYVAVTMKRAGRTAAALLPETIAAIVPGLAFPKSMRWLEGANGGASGGADARFARPVRWVVALLGDEVLELELFGLRAGRASRGHRFLHPGEVTIASPTGYVEALATARVVVDPRLREQVFLEQAEALAKSAGGRLVEDRELVEINNDLIERPQALLGRFDASYLDLPREVIVTALREHQRYFAVEDTSGALLPAFVAARNGDDRNLEGIARGNAAVLRARLDDARFYWDTDLKKAPGERVDELTGIVWLEGMGSVRDKAERVRRLARFVAESWDASQVATVERAAMLAKTDLLSEMIGSGKEYASLEGVMGAYYAARHGEPEAVCAAIREHVRPRGAGDALPESAAGAALAIADRADSVAGSFVAGKIPSGSEDPYGVRRSANGVVRILLEQGRHLDLSALTTVALAGYAAGRDGGAAPRSIDAALPGKLEEFWGGRLATALSDRGYAYDESAAALSGTEGGADPVDVERRAAALKRWRGNADFVPLVIGFKRVANILRAATEEPLPFAGTSPDPVELALAGALHLASTEAEPHFAARDYDRVLGVLLGLRAPIDTFFDGVMVNVDDLDVRRRRLGLLAAVRALFDRGWDLSKVVVEG
jgi:glycyl-tRNA synthetase beta chain